MRQCCAVYDDARHRIVLYYTGDADSAGLTGALRACLPRYMLPGVLHRLERMPLTPNGKVDRKGLKQAAMEEK